MKNKCKECGEDNPRLMAKASKTTYRNYCIKHYSEQNYGRVVRQRLEKEPWNVWSCRDCGTLNSKVRSYCRSCKEYTREQSIKEDL